MPRVKWHAIFIGNSRIERALHVVNGLGDKVKVQFSICEEVVQESCLLELGRVS